MHGVEPDIVLEDASVFGHQEDHLVGEDLNRSLSFWFVVQQFHPCVGHINFLKGIVALDSSQHLVRAFIAQLVTLKFQRPQFRIDICQNLLNILGPLPIDSAVLQRQFIKSVVDSETQRQLFQSFSHDQIII